MFYLRKILGSETKIKMLFVLVSHPRSSYMEKELAKDSGSSISEINRQIPDLVKSGLVIMQRVGKAKLYSINKQHFLYSPLNKLLIDLNKIYKKIGREINEFVIQKSKYIKTIILLGSLRQGNIREDIIEEPSDIDFVFIVESDKNVKRVKKLLIEYINEKISLKYGIVIYPFVISQREYLIRLNNKDAFILESYIKGKVVYGKKPERFSPMGD